LGLPPAPAVHPVQFNAPLGHSYDVKLNDNHRSDPPSPKFHQSLFWLEFLKHSSNIIHHVVCQVQPPTPTFVVKEQKKLSLPFHEDNGHPNEEVMVESYKDFKAMVLIYFLLKMRSILSWW
jgi:hypothetical protein